MRSVLVSLMCLGLCSSYMLPELDVTRLEPSEPECRADLHALKHGLATGQLWAQTMVDAGVKSPVGLLSQTAIQFGDFDECLSVNIPLTGQYCLVDVSPKEGNFTLWTPFKWAICVPDSCSAEVLQTTLQTYMDHHGESVVVGLIPEACTTSKTASRDITVEDIIFCTVLVTVILAIGAATALDLLRRPDYDGVSPPASVIQCLSLRHSLSSLRHISQPVPGVNLSALYGLHSCACVFVVLGHRFGFHLAFMTLTNYRSVEKMFVDSWFSIWADHMDLFVDLFFFLSAFLLALLYYAVLHKRFVSPFVVYAHRLCRILPVYVVVVFFYATVLRQLGDGPLWNLFMDEEQGKCRGNWWTNLLFINNHVETENICIIQSWFLSCDFQLFVSGIVLVLLLQKCPRTGMVVTVIVFVLSTVAPFLGTYLYKRPAILFYTKDFWTTVRQHDMFFSVYSQSYYRGTSYLPGLLAGCYVYTQKGKHLSKGRTYTLQVMGLLCCLLVYWSGSMFYNTSPPDPLVSALYAAFFHTAFGLGLALTVVSFCLGKITAVTRVLSWSGFVVLSKLSYGVFLVHVVPQFLWIASSRTAVYLNPLELVSWAIADLVISLIVALILFLTVEAPTKYLMRHYVTGHRLITSLPVTTEREMIMNACNSVEQEEKHNNN